MLMNILGLSCLVWMVWMGDAKMVEPAVVPRLGCDPYCINYRNISEVVFSNTTDHEFILYFNISNSNKFNAMQDVRGKVMNFDCSSDVPDAESLVDFNISDDIVDLGGGFQELVLFLDINEGEIQGSDLWRNITNSTGVIDFCMKTEIIAGNTSVSFQNMQMQIMVNMTAGFDMTATAEHPNATIEDVAANVNYAVTGCICNPLDCTCSSDPLKQNEEFNLCITSSSDEVKVSEVFSLFMYQEDVLKFSPIEYGTKFLTEVDYDGSCTSVKSRAVSELFTASPPPRVTAKGTTFMTFSTNEGEAVPNRLLRKSHGLAPLGEVVAFDVTIDLQGPAVPDASDNKNNLQGNKHNLQTVAEAQKSSAVGLFVMLLVLFFVLGGTVVVWRSRSKRMI